MTLRIELKDGNVDIFKNSAFTDYEWKPTAFIVIRGEQWIAIYNWDEVKRVNCMEDDLLSTPEGAEICNAVDEANKKLSAR